MRTIILVALFVFSNTLMAADSVFVAEKKADFESTYKQVYKALENNRFFVVFEPDIGANLSGFAKKWKDHNQNKLDRIKSMVFCNGWYANRVSNLDTRMLAFCPMRMTLIEKDGRTTALFARPTVIAADSPARETLEELENEVIAAIKKGMSH